MLVRVRSESVPPQVLILGGIASVQFGAAFANKLFDEAGPAGVVLMRLAFSGLVLVLLTRPRMRGRTRAEIGAAVLFGLVLGTMNWTFYEALHRIPLGPAVTIEFAGPLTLAIVGSRKLLDLLWAAMAAAGVALLAFNHAHGGLNTSGVLLALLAGVLWVCYILLSQRVGSGFPGLQGLAVALVVGSVLLIPFGVYQGGSALLRGPVLLGGLGVALLSSLIPYSLELMALRRMAAATFGLLMSLEPAFGALAGIVVLGQHLGLRTVVAVVLVIAASVGTTLEAGRHAAATRPAPEAVAP